MKISLNSKQKLELPVNNSENTEYIFSKEPKNQQKYIKVKIKIGNQLRENENRLKFWGDLGNCS